MAHGSSNSWMGLNMYGSYVNVFQVKKGFWMRFPCWDTKKEQGFFCLGHHYAFVIIQTFINCHPTAQPKPFRATATQTLFNYQDNTVLVKTICLCVRWSHIDSWFLFIYILSLSSSQKSHWLGIPSLWKD